MQALEQQGYQVQPVEDQLVWKVSLPDQDWLVVVTFLPRPVAQWRVLPATSNDDYAVIYKVIEQAIGGRR